MLIYIVLLLLLTASVLITQKNKKMKDIRYVALLVLLGLVAGLRYGIGTDFITYKQYYDGLLSNVIPWSNFEIGYYLLNHTLAYFRCNYQILFIVTSGISLAFVGVTIKKYSKNPALSLLLYAALYFYFASFNIIRQYIAVSIVFFAFPYLLDQKMWKYMAWVLFASLFHSSALAMIPCYFLLNLKIPSRYRLIIVCVGILGAIVGRPVLSAILTLVPKYAVYADFETGSAWCDLLVIVINMLLLYFYGNLEQYPKKANLFINANLFSFLFAALTFCNVLFARLYVYFHIFSLLSFPFAIAGIPIEKRKFVLTGLCVASCAVCVYYFFGNNGGVVPYRITSFR